MIDRILHRLVPLHGQRPFGEFGFNFDWHGMDMLVIDNPLDDPARWRVSSQTPVAPRDGIFLGAACTSDGEWMYSYGIRPDEPERRLYVARRPLREADGEWQWWTDARWGGDGSPTALFPQAAPEMTVSPYKGGWLAVYSPTGMSNDVALRWAPSPSGPWSDPQVAYTAPEGDRGLLVYGARAHPELASGDNLVISYNCNGRDERTVLGDASAYAPRVVQLSTRMPQVADGLK